MYKVESLKDLTNLVKAMRKLGVKSISVDGVDIQLGDEPARTPAKRAKTAQVESQPQGPVDMPDFLTDEQLLMYSVKDAFGTSTPEGGN